MKTVHKQKNGLQKIKGYLLKNFERDAQVILVGLGCLFFLQILTDIIPLYFSYYLHTPVFPPFLSPGQYEATSIYVWIGYLISGAVVGRIANQSPVLFAIGVGFIFAILYISFLGHLLTPSVNLYQAFAVQEFFSVITFMGIGGLIGKGLQKK